MVALMWCRWCPRGFECMGGDLCVWLDVCVAVRQGKIFIIVVKFYKHFTIRLLKSFQLIQKNDLLSFPKSRLQKKIIVL